MRRALRVSALAFSLGLALTLATSHSSHAQCNYPAMTSGTAVHYPAGTNVSPTFLQSTNYWSAVGVRPDAGSDWDLSVNTSAAGFPACATGNLATSQYGAGAVDVVIGDFNHNAQGTFFAKPYPFSGVGGATVEWDDGPDQLAVNGLTIGRTTGPNDVLESWDVFLDQGKEYFFYLRNEGTASLRFLFFQSPNGVFWAGRQAAIYESPTISNGALSVGFFAPASDWFGIVVVNENGEVANYQVNVTTCVPPTVLASATPVFVNGAEREFSFLQQNDYFTAIGARANNPSEDWGIQVYAGPYDVNSGACLLNEIVHSYFATGKTEYIVGDFNGGSNPTGTTFYARALALSGGLGAGQVEWDDGPDQLVVDAPYTQATTNSQDVLSCWDVFLTAGQAYTFHFASMGAASLQVGLFQNPGSTYWVTRSDAIEEHNTSFEYTATLSDWYGVVVANDNASPANYEIGVNTSVVGVGDSPLLVTGLEGVAPNPVVPGSHIRYALRDGADVRFDVLDASGRRVSRIAEGARTPGHWTATWSGAGDDGRRLTAGMYFLRMLVDGRMVEGSKIVLLP